MNRTGKLLAPLLGAGLILAGCNGNGGGPDNGESAPLTYWLWDDRQQPAYEQCAAAFEGQTGIAVEIEQFGWGDYWPNLTTQFAAGRAPDVFTNHLAFAPEFIADGVLVPITDQVSEAGLDLDIYFPGLADLWVSQEGDRYGLPKDWDTIAFVYHEEHLADAGLTVADLWDATWDPADGGSFEEIIAKLTVDGNGVRGDEPGFDPDDIAVYGLGYEDPANHAAGQTSWGNLARSTGFDFLADQNPWGSQYQFDDPRLAQTLDWFRRAVEAGYAMPLEVAQGAVGREGLFEAGEVAMSFEGSWMIGHYTGLDLPVGFAPLPTGPTGRWSMYNGLADSITTSSSRPDDAWQWVQYLASADCQELVGELGVVFPAIDSATEMAQAAHLANGVDVTAYTVHVQEGTTFLGPVSDNFSQVNATLSPALEEIFLGLRPAADALADAQATVDQIMGQ